MLLQWGFWYRYGYRYGYRHGYGFVVFGFFRRGRASKCPAQEFPECAACPEKNEEIENVAHTGSGVKVGEIGTTR